MASQSRITALAEEMGLSYALEAHYKAHYSLSHYGNPKPLDAIPQEQRDEIAKFYKILRDRGIYCYNPETGKAKEITGYYEAWVRTLRNDPDRPEMQHVTVSQVNDLIHNSTDELKKRIGFRERKPPKSQNKAEIPKVGDVLKITHEFMGGLK